jgi:hypothetical protein
VPVQKARRPRRTTRRASGIRDRNPSYRQSARCVRPGGSRAFAHVASHAESAFALPAVARSGEIGILGDRDGRAGTGGLPVASSAIPFVAVVMQEGIRRHIDLRARSVGPPVSADCIAIRTRRVQVGIRRHDDRHAGLADVSVASIAIPSASVALRVGVGRRSLRGALSRRCRCKD